MDEQTNSPTSKIAEPISCAYSMSTIWGLDQIENKQFLYHEKYFMKMFCKSSKRKQYSLFWKEKFFTANKRRTKIILRCKSMLYLWENNLSKSSLKVKIMKKLQIITIMQVNKEVQQKAFVMRSMKSLYFFHNCSSCGYHFIIKTLSNEFVGKIGVMG